VVVSFLEGDPDQPLILGSLHNDANMPPYELPGAATQSVFRTHTHDGDGYNELRIDDKKDAEEIYILAQRDFKRVVKNNDVLEVGLETKDKGDQSIKIQNDQVIEIGNDRKLAVKNLHEIKVEGDENVAITKNQAIDVGQDQTVSVTGAHKLKGQTCLIEGQTSIELKVGASSIKIEAGKITISSPQIALDAKGTGEFKASGPLTLQGAIVKIN
jgi:type VI secretion system secreted protein VgrG